MESPLLLAMYVHFQFAVHVMSMRGKMVTSLVLNARLNTRGIKVSPAPFVAAFSIYA
jgi:hypothetical protein